MAPQYRGGPAEALSAGLCTCVLARTGVWAYAMGPEWRGEACLLSCRGLCLHELHRRILLWLYRCLPASAHL